MKQSMKIVFDSKLVFGEKINDEFTYAYCYVCAEGKNRNGSFISESAIKEALPTLWNVPVIAHVFQDADGNYQVGGHDYEIAQDKDGSYYFKSQCVPYGVVPENPDGVLFEEVEEEGRGVARYLKVPVVIWSKRFPEITEAFMNSEKLFGQSMEINVSEYQDYAEDPNFVEIQKFSFSALTLLGENVEPCFPEAKVISSEFSVDDNFNNLMAQLKEELSFCFSSKPVKGGNDMEETKNIEEVNGAATEEFAEAPAPEVTAVDEPAADPITEGAPVVTEAFSTYGEKRCAIEKAFVCNTERDGEGKLIHCKNYWLCDFDDQYAYVEVEEFADGEWSSKYGRVPYAYNEDSKEAQLTGEFEETVWTLVTAEEQAKLEAMRGEYEALKEYKATREDNDRKSALDSVVDEFAYLAGNEEFEALTEKKYEFACVEDLKNACYIIKGKYSIVPNQHKNSELVVGIGTPKSTLTLREKLHEEYGKNK